MDSRHQLQKPGKLIGTIGSSLLHLWTWILTFMASLIPPESKSSWDLHIRTTELGRGCQITAQTVLTAITVIDQMIGLAIRCDPGSIRRHKCLMAGSCQWRHTCTSSCALWEFALPLHFVMLQLAILPSSHSISCWTLG